MSRQPSEPVLQATADLLSMVPHEFDDFVVLLFPQESNWIRGVQIILIFNDHPWVTAPLDGVLSSCPVDLDQTQQIILETVVFAN